MISEPITSEELKELVQEQIGGKIEDPSFNLESPYAVSLPLSDWKRIIKCLREIELLQDFFRGEFKLTAGGKYE